ncbi:MAG TPA: TonB-dependent receptor [Vicinamibacterales bacterium]|nr:TonB-dependent receptor [Vicinamibacterales bacterium]
MGNLLFVIVLALSLAAPWAAAGQTQTGTITGIVSDNQGAVLPGVTVELTGATLIRPQSTVTNERGVYNFIALPPGSYSLRFELQGFAQVERPDIRVAVARVTSVNQAMQVAGLSENITVTAAAPVVDSKSTSRGTNFDTDLLENIPQSREIWSTVEQMPGATMSKFNVGGAESAQQSSMQVHGSMPGQQEYAINGLKLNWPGGNGGATAFYFDHDSSAEINIMTNGAPAEVGTGGVYMNMVTKAGGNTLSGGTSIFWEDDSFQGDNITDELRNIGVRSGNPINYIYDFNANLGGPIRRDRVWFFSSFRRFDINTEVLGITRADGSPAADVNHQSNFLGKITAQVDDDNKISGEYNFNYQNRFFRRPTGDLVEEKASWRQIEPASIAQFQWTSVLSESLFFDARYGYLHLIFPLRYQPEVSATDFARQDIIRRTLRDAATYDFENLATRNQLNASLSYFVERAGSHTFKAGYEYGRATNRNSYAANGDYVLRYFDGVPFEVQAYNTPVTSDNHINTMALYVQDSWIVNPRLTLNLGGRFERLVGSAPEQSRPGNAFFGAEQFGALDDIPKWQNGMWRLGASYDVNGDGRTAVKAFVGRFMVQEGTRLVQQVNPNSLGGDFRSWTDLNGNDTAEPNELGPSTRPFGGRVNRIDPDLQQAYSDEFSVGIDRQLVGDLAASATYYRRHNRRLFSGINTAVTPEDYTAITVAGPEGPVTVYQQSPETLGLADRVITTIPGLDNTYNGIEFTIVKRMRDNWQILGGYTLGKTEGLYDRGLNDDFNNPNLNINREGSIIGQDSTHLLKLVGTYVFPRAVTFSTNLRYSTGQPVVKQVTLRGLNQGTVSILAEPRGTTRLDNVTLWDVRLSKIFRFGAGQELEAMVDVFNLLNQEAATVINPNVGALFGRPTAILPPRVARLGLSYKF